MALRFTVPEKTTEQLQAIAASDTRRLSAVAKATLRKRIHDQLRAELARRAEVARV